MNHNFTLPFRPKLQLVEPSEDKGSEIEGLSYLSKPRAAAEMASQSYYELYRGSRYCRSQQSEMTTRN